LLLEVFIEKDKKIFIQDIFVENYISPNHLCVEKKGNAPAFN
jgi:hypothetical protein